MCQVTVDNSSSTDKTPTSQTSSKLGIEKLDINKAKIGLLVATAADVALFAFAFMGQMLILQAVTVVLFFTLLFVNWRIENPVDRTPPSEREKQLQEELNASRELNSSLQTENTDLKSSTPQNDPEKEKMRERLEELEVSVSGIAQKDAMLEELRGKLGATEKERDALTEDNNRLQEENLDLTARFDELSRTMDTDSSKLDESTVIIEQKEDRIRELEEQINQLETSGQGGEISMDDVPQQFLDQIVALVKVAKHDQEPGQQEKITVEHLKRVITALEEEPQPPGDGAKPSEIRQFHEKRAAYNALHSARLRGKSVSEQLQKK